MFTPDEKFLIADFYSKHKAVFDNASRKNDRNVRVQQLLRQLTDTINSTTTKTKTLEQVRTSLKNLKSSAKAKSVQNNKSQRQTGGGSDDEMEMDDAETLIASQLIDTPSYAGLVRSIESGSNKNTLESISNDPRKRKSASASSITTASSNAIGNSSIFSGNPLSAEFSPAMVLDLSSDPDGSSEGLEAVDKPSTSGASSSTSKRGSNGNKKKPKASTKSQDDAVDLRTLQREVLETQKAAYSEFRLAIFEHRLTLRGADVTQFGLQLPPGARLPSGEDDVQQ